MRVMADKRQKSSLLNIHGRWLTAGTALAAMALLAGCQEEPPQKADIRPVKVIVAKSAPTEKTVSYSGEIKPRVETTLGFRVSGKIIDRLANTGDRVNAGQVIARLDATDLKLAEASAKASVISARTRLEVARLALERAKSLYPNGYISKSTLDSRQLEFDSAKSALEAAENDASQAVNAVSYAELKAGAGGIITAVLAEPGTVVSAGSPVFTLAEDGGLEVEIDVPEHEVQAQKPGQTAAVKLWANADVTAKATIREIAGSADAQTRTYTVRAVIENPPPAMRLGMTATLILTQTAGQPGIVVPITALLPLSDGVAVFTVDKESKTVRQRPVATGALSGDGITVSGGIQDGDIVVTGGVQFLKEGMQVRLAEDDLRTARLPTEPASK